MEDLITYAEWVELETFFSGYLLVYAFISLIAVNRTDPNFIKRVVLPNLPLAYAFVGTLYGGLQLKNAWPEFSFQFHYLKIWGLLSILCWIPFFRKKAAFPLLHSAVFFFLLMKSFATQVLYPATGNHVERNNIKIYSASILLNLATLILVILISSAITRFRHSKRSGRVKENT